MFAPTGRSYRHHERRDARPATLYKPQSAATVWWAHHGFTTVA
jgi:hypothetical protein